MAKFTESILTCIEHMTCTLGVYRTFQFVASFLHQRKHMSTMDFLMYHMQVVQEVQSSYIRNICSHLHNV